MILVCAVFGGASTGVVTSQFPPAPDAPFLLNAWRFQALFIIFLMLAPFIYIYENHYLKLEKYRMHLEYLKQKGIKLNKRKDVESQLEEENMVKLVDRQKHNHNHNHHKKLSYEEKYPERNSTTTGRPSLESQNSILTAYSLFDIENTIGFHTYWKNLLSLTILSSILQIMWQYAKVWGSLGTI